MTTGKQRAAARRNIKKAARTARRKRQLRTYPKRPALLSAKKAPRLHEGNEAARNKDKCSGGAAAMSFCETTGTALSSAAFSSTFARTRLASLFPATSSAFFTTALVRLIHGRPCSAFRFFAAYSAFLIASLNLRCLSFLLRCVFFLASSCHGLPPG